MKGCKIDIQSVKNYLLEKNEKKLAIKTKERDEILSMIRRLSKLWEKYGVERVYLYGSMVEFSFNKYSDIDIAVEPDLDFENLLKLYSEINRYSKREVDIRLLSELPFREKIRKEGILVYERKHSCIFSGMPTMLILIEKNLKLLLKKH
ncbi:nucleotidyltransferase family protein [Thermodesulfovibrio yellowstonii]|uniref:Nucleotidyltransferase domain protein n=1 Tax=Thermodesulfovibrio yellowstonii (strain ATCC 51303 / DSM 11347 / YP87) TaxID=289376 RepID=B5YJ63_THEYD|nr:nucleotidyltransferase domain-containing protein [Thermodesulfovibrio yellowstonii]ACI20645.1 nucleotidyltransferase domain protein [Thermodesulfovibrio yellowstonii DSM 11347]